MDYATYFRLLDLYHNNYETFLRLPEDVISGFYARLFRKT